MVIESTVGGCRQRPQAHILGKMGILGSVLLRIYAGTNLPIFIESGSLFTDNEQNISWHSFFRHAVYTSAVLLLLNSYWSWSWS